MTKDKIFRVFEWSAYPNQNFYIRSAYVIAPTASKAKKAAKENRVLNWGNPVRQAANEYNNDSTRFVEYYIDGTYSLTSKYFWKTLEPWMKNPEKPLDKVA